jgi:transposase
VTDGKIERSVYIKSCVKLNEPATESLEMLREAFGEYSLRRAAVFEWHSCFNAGRVSLEDDKRSGRPSTSKTTEIVEKIVNSTTKTVAEQSMSSQTPLGSVVEFAWRSCAALLLHHDNAPEHVSRKTKEFVTNNDMIIVPHPPYLPDLAPCDFALFPKLKIKLKGRFEKVSNIQRESHAVLESILVLLKRVENDGIAVYVPKETIWKEMAAKSESVKPVFLLT